MSHVEIAAMAPDARPSFVLDGVERGDFIAATATAATAGSPAFAFHRSKDIRVRMSRAAADTTLATADNQTA